jgi:hypothetical protein
VVDSEEFSNVWAWRLAGWADALDQRRRPAVLTRRLAAPLNKLAVWLEERRG